MAQATRLRNHVGAQRERHEKGVMKMNLLIENYDDECGLDYYYIQNNEIKEFGDEIFKKLNKITVTPLLLNSFFENYEG